MTDKPIKRKKQDVYMSPSIYREFRELCNSKGLLVAKQLEDALLDKIKKIKNSS